MNAPSPRTEWRSAGVCLLAGIVLLAMHALALHPTVLLARLAAGDGTISPAFEALLIGSHVKLAWLLLPAALLALRPDRLYQSLHRILLAPSGPAFGCLLGASAFALAWGVQQGIFGSLPHVTDAVTHLFQAKILAAGHLTAPLPAIPEGFLHPHVVMTTDGRWFSKYPPGHALLLLAGMKTGCLSCVVPLAHAALALLLSRLLSTAMGTAAGRAGGLLFVASPLAILLGASYMSHTTWLAGFLLGLVLLLPAPSKGTAPSALAAGGAFGFSFLIRPQDTVFGAIATALALLVLGWPALRSVITRCHWLALGAAPFLVGQVLWNHTTCGHFIAIGYGFTQAGYLFPTFQSQYGLSETFTWRDAARQSFWTILRFNKALFGWPTSLIFLPLAAWTRERRLAVALTLVALLFAGVYGLYNYYGAEYEARYYYPLIPSAIGLTVLGIRALPGAHRRGLAVLAVLVGFAHSAWFYLPCQLAPVYTHDYEMISPRLHETAERQVQGPALILLSPGPASGFHYASGFIYNDPWLTNRIIYAMDLPGRTGDFQRAYPARRVYRFSPPDSFTPLD